MIINLLLIVNGTTIFIEIMLAGILVDKSIQKGGQVKLRGIEVEQNDNGWEHYNYRVK